MTYTLPYEKSIVANVQSDHAQKVGTTKLDTQAQGCVITVTANYEEILVDETRRYDYSHASVSSPHELVRAADLINGSMTWSTTPEGSGYWSDVCERLRRAAHRSLAEY